MTPVAIQLSSAALLAGTAGAVFSYAYLAPSSGLFLPVISRGDAQSRAVALTFDDGPTPGGTERVLDLLAKHDVKAAFFVIGANASKYPALLRRMDNEGHLVCNHSFDHLRCGAMRSASFWRDQLERTDAAIEQAIGKRPAFFRPPMGHKSPSMRTPLRERAQVAVCWSRRGLDGIATTSARIVRRLVPGANAGDILLLHDGREMGSHRDPGPTIGAIEPVIAGIRAKGLGFERLDRLIGREAYFATRATAGSGSP